MAGSEEVNRVAAAHSLVSRLRQHGYTLIALAQTLEEHVAQATDAEIESIGALLRGLDLLLPVPQD